MQIAISIKNPIYRAYLKGIFELKDNRLVLTRDHDFGKVIISRVQYSSRPKTTVVDHTTVVFDLPSGRSLATAKNYHLYISKEDQLKINEQLEAIFNIDFDRHCIQGKKLSMMQKDVIQAFILSRKIISLIGDNETLKKKEYRDQLSVIKKYADQLRKKAYYLNSKIEKSLKRHKDLIAS